MKNRLELFEEAMRKCNELIQLYPDLVVLVSIKNQIEYLLQLENKTNSDRSRLVDIIIGIQTAREIEQVDENAAELFYEVSSEVKRM